MPAPARQALVDELAAQLRQAIALQRATLDLDSTGFASDGVRELGWRQVDLALDRLVDAL